MSAAGFIDVRGISKGFRAAERARPVLRDVTLSVSRGEFVSLVGAMGTGKSTLLNVVAGLTPPDGGSVTIGGEPVRGFRHDAAFVFQNYSLLPWFTALENVRLAVEAADPSLSRHEQTTRSEHALRRVGLGAALGRRPRQLSGGMRQRVAIARAFATRPRILFLDNPFGALDAMTREALEQDLAGMCAAEGREVTTLMITNSVEEAILLSDRIIPLIPGPPATLGPPIPVDLPRPRSLDLLAHDAHATRVRADVVAALTGAMALARGRSTHPPSISPVLLPASEA